MFGKGGEMESTVFDSDVFGKRHAEDFRQLIMTKSATAVVGAYDGVSAALAKEAGFEALYLSGAALSASLALPDLGLISMDEVLRAARTIIRASSLPLLVDCDTGYGEALNVMRLTREFEDIGVAAIQIEDQILPKKCGHLNDKRLLNADEMCLKIAAAKRVARKISICARTDAGQVSLDEAISRANRYAEAGADFIFVEALRNRDDMQRVRSEVRAPLMANMTEFGRTPQTDLIDWDRLGYELVIYPVSAFRVAAKSMQQFYQLLKTNGHARDSIDSMMTREELYKVIRYFEFEELDQTIVKSAIPSVSKE
jgi:methylisocitrate lyase